MLAHLKTQPFPSKTLCALQCHRLPIYECETSWFVLMCSDRLARIIPSSLTFHCARKKTLWGISELPLDTDMEYMIIDQLYNFFHQLYNGCNHFIIVQLISYQLAAIIRCNRKTFNPRQSIASYSQLCNSFAAIPFKRRSQLLNCRTQLRLMREVGRWKLP